MEILYRLSYTISVKKGVRYLKQQMYSNETQVKMLNLNNGILLAQYLLKCRLVRYPVFKAFKKQTSRVLENLRHINSKN